MDDSPVNESITLIDVFVVQLKNGFVNGIFIGVIGLIGFVLGRNYFNFYTGDHKNRAKQLLTSLGMKSVTPTLNKYELLIASQLVNPSDIDTTFSDIGGLDDVVKDIQNDVILPLVLYPFIKAHSTAHLKFCKPPKGVLLYGPPGCGKTTIAKATAKEANARFLNLEVQMLTDKWYGESQKLSTAVFTLAKKIQPCIIFIDEIDTFLRSRGSNDHEATTMMKAQFMILWDGLNSKTDDCGIVVMGATNRPNDVDAAILRRMPVMFPIPLPNFTQRASILKHLLKDTLSIQNDIDVFELSKLTQDFSGSDLKETCRKAGFAPVRDRAAPILKLINSKADGQAVVNYLKRLSNVTMEDFRCAVKNLKESMKPLVEVPELEHSCHKHK